MSLQPAFILPPTADRPDAEAVRFGDHHLSWAEVERRARQVAQGMRQAGVGVDDAVGILARNQLEWAELLIGNSRNGSRYVPLNWHLLAPELADQLTDSGAKLLIVAQDLAEIGQEAARLAGVDQIIVIGPEYEAWLDAAGDEVLPDGPIGSALQFTGGTTGRSKGVNRSDQSGLVSAFAPQSGRWGELVGMPERSNYLLCTPAYHALGGGTLRVALARGCRVDIMDRWEPEAMLALIQQRQINSISMVPTQFIRLLKLDEATRARYDIGSIQWILHTAGPCPAWAKRGMIDWFGPVIVELYGSSEGAGPVVATSQEWLERPGTVGRASRVLELSVVGDDGQDLPPGEIGAIYIKRFDGTPSYFGDPEKTKNMVLADGRFTVGDVGWLDEEGYLFLADRRVDLIISGGTNIYPAEIEACLSSHPAVADVAVFGVPDPEWGQIIQAVVEPVLGAAIDEATLQSYVREHLSGFKVPRRVDFIDSMPREASGKLKKYVLRDQYLDSNGADAAETTSARR